MPASSKAATDSRILEVARRRYKQIAARPKDLEDIEALSALYPKLSSGRIRQRVAELQALLREGEELTPKPAPRKRSTPRRAAAVKKPSSRRAPKDAKKTSRK